VELINFAHGDVFTLGGFLSLTIVARSRLRRSLILPRLVMFLIGRCCLVW
jgi:branched-subunit amino acid ABC-type transport system permease component